MTIQEAIARVDELMPNQYSTEQKIHWLSTLDGKIFHEVIMTHHGAAFAYYPFEGYETDDEELLVKPPYADDVYGYYLQSRIAEANSEWGKYNQLSELFNAAYSDYTAWYNRTHMPVQGGRWKM